MDFQGLLNEVMAATQQGGKKGGKQSGGGMSDMTKGALGGAVGGSLLTLLVGSKKGRKMGKKAMKLGGAAALGALAFKVYKDWQQGEQHGGGTSTPAPVAPSPAPAALPDESEQHAMLLLKAMIAAAKADGHIDDDEKARIQQAVELKQGSPEVQQFVQLELDKPLDPAEIAAGVSNQEQAAEVYLASVVMVDEQNCMEKAYLQELAKQLRLPSDLVLKLEAHAES
jgi:uncharacterized membrane protein YebE (DUF533 family)